jgi:hypothetical protein
MKKKTVITHLLLYFVVASLAFLAGKCCRTDPVVDETKAEPVKDGVVVTYYFMGVKRCDACQALDKYSQKTVRDRFVDKGVKYEFVDCDKQQNKHFIDELELESKSIVISIFKGGKRDDWIVLDMGEAFTLVREPSSKPYEDFLAEQIESVLKIAGK